MSMEKEVFPTSFFPFLAPPVRPRTTAIAQTLRRSAEKAITSHAILRWPGSPFPPPPPFFFPPPPPLFPPFQPFNSARRLGEFFFFPFFCFFDCFCRQMGSECCHREGKRRIPAIFSLHFFLPGSDRWSTVARRDLREGREVTCVASPLPPPPFSGAHRRLNGGPRRIVYVGTVFSPSLSPSFLFCFRYLLPTGNPTCTGHASKPRATRTRAGSSLFFFFFFSSLVFLLARVLSVGALRRRRSDGSWPKRRPGLSRRSGFD